MIHPFFSLIRRWLLPEGLECPGVPGDPESPGASDRAGGPGSRYSADLGVSATCLGDKGKITLNISDIFNSLVSRYDIASFGVSSVNTQKTESRVVKLVFTWKFGNKALKNPANRRAGIDDLRQRMGGN